MTQLVNLGIANNMVIKSSYDIFPFGKHKGSNVATLVNCDPDYLIWAMQEGAIKFEGDGKTIEEKLRKIVTERNDSSPSAALAEPRSFLNSSQRKKKRWEDGLDHDGLQDFGFDLCDDHW